MVRIWLRTDMFTIDLFAHSTSSALTLVQEDASTNIRNHLDDPDNCTVNTTENRQTKTVEKAEKKREIELNSQMARDDRERNYVIRRRLRRRKCILKK